MAFKKFEIFIQQHPKKISEEFLPEKTLKKIAKEIDEPYSDFLREHGVAGYDNGFIWSVDPYEFTDQITNWKLNKKTDHIIARTAFGDLFLWTGRKVMMVQVNYNKIAEYGGDSIARLYDISFLNPRAMTKMFYKDLFDKAVKKLGPLKPDECYGFVPALPLGGKEDVKNLQKIQLKPYLEMLSQA
jgi:hypothetical protein